jgi:co-chaperonin GroES (HSP10)
MTEMTALEEKWALEEAEKAAAAVAQATADAIAVAEARKDHDEQVSGIREHLPQATGWRVIVLPYRGARKTKGGIELADQTLERQQLTTTCAYVLSVGPLAYKDEAKFPTGAWCKEGDWIIFGRYAGARMAIDGGEIRILNDDEILATIKDPEDILHI